MVHQGAIPALDLTIEAELLVGVAVAVFALCYQPAVVAASYLRPVERVTVQVDSSTDPEAA